MLIYDSSMSMLWRQVIEITIYSIVYKTCYFNSLEPLLVVSWKDRKKWIFHSQELGNPFHRSEVCKKKPRWDLLCPFCTTLSPSLSLWSSSSINYKKKNTWLILWMQIQFGFAYFAWCAQLIPSAVVVVVVIVVGVSHTECFCDKCSRVMGASCAPYIFWK